MNKTLQVVGVGFLGGLVLVGIKIGLDVRAIRVTQAHQLVIQTQESVMQLLNNEIQVELVKQGVRVQQAHFATFGAQGFTPVGQPQAPGQP